MPCALCAVTLYGLSFILLVHLSLIRVEWFSLKTKNMRILLYMWVIIYLLWSGENPKWLALTVPSEYDALDQNSIGLGSADGRRLGKQVRGHALPRYVVQINFLWKESSELRMGRVPRSYRCRIEHTGIFLRRLFNSKDCKCRIQFHTKFCCDIFYREMSILNVLKRSL